MTENQITFKLDGKDYAESDLTDQQKYLIGILQQIQRDKAAASRAMHIADMTERSALVELRATLETDEADEPVN